MKYLDSLVFVVLAAAVLIAAYGAGLLVRRARMPATEPAAGRQAEPNATNGPSTVAPERPTDSNEPPQVVADSSEPASDAPPPEPNVTGPNEPADPRLTGD